MNYKFITFAQGKVMEISLRRIPSLDGLRTISIALVIIGHSSQVLGVSRFAHLGTLGVRVFFVISGFLITGLLLKEIEKTSKINLLKFYLRRTLRIFPPFYFYLLVIFIATMFGFFEIAPKYFLLTSAYMTDYVSSSNWILGHSWSLAVEEQFYLIFPGLLLLLGLKKTKLFLVFLVLLGPIIRITDYRVFGSETGWAEKGFHIYMDALATGCLLALFYCRLHQNFLYKKFLASKLVFIFPIFILFFNVQGDHPHIYAVVISMMNIMIALCIDWAVTNYDSITGKFLNSAPMTTLGMMSYSIYLWQQPFLNPFDSRILTILPFSFIWIAIMTLFSYFFVEKYSLKLRNKLESIFYKAPVLTTTQNVNSVSP